MRSYFASLLSLGFAVPLLAAPLAFELKVDTGTLIRHTEPAPVQAVKDRFGPGLDSVDLEGARGNRTQLLLPCRGITEGDYYLGLLVLCGHYSAADEGLNGQVQLYLGGQRIGWTSHSEPLLPADAAEQSRYQAELLCEEPVHLKPSDTLRVVYAMDWAAAVIGPVRLYRTRPVHGIVKLDPPDWGRTQSYLLTAEWGTPEEAGGRVRQPVVLHNPSTLTRIFSVQTDVRDYQQRSLLSARDSVPVEAGRTITRMIEFAPEGERTRLTVTCTAPGMFPPVRLVKYYVRDRTEGPRPNTCLNGPWEMCWVPGAEVGDRPPAGAAWEKVNVPSSQSNEKYHCAWYRLAFDAPAHVRGDRYLLRFGQVLSEVTIHVNGQSVGYEKHGTQPFEVDITAGYRPGQRNELLVGVRDWLAYSPVNRDRVARGEQPLFKDRMVDVAGYEAASHLGIGGSVWLEARPNVSVDDVFVVTSVRRKQLELHYRLLNRTPDGATVTLAPRVFDAGGFARAVPEKRLVIPARKEATVDLEVPWPNPQYWWPDDPHLYTLRTVLTPDGGPPDEHVQRFGFRELWIDGINFVLNGTRVKLRSAWAGGASGVYAAAGIVAPAERLAAIWNWQTISREDRMVQVARTHNMGGVEEACDVADETGLILKIEDADVAQVSFTFDQTFWNNALRNEVRVVDTFKNHASVCLWSAGNENMWGWIYQGEAAKTLGNRWQLNICKAMREFDLQGRPIEWEADGDLMGGWEHHALHYPRELNQHPDLPVGAWWGALDGKTVVPYSMGPITLGEKPLTVGEAFWPANLNRPQGASIVLGDDAYLGGGGWARAWIESSRYFMNGFRDAEFALIDVYLPLWMLPPQTVVVKEETRSFVGGHSIHRTLNVHNDLFRAATLTLTWGVAGERAIAGATQTLKLAPAELRRIDLAIPLPATKAAQRATFRVQLSEGPRRIEDQRQAWTIHPPTTAGAPAGKLAVFDPAGRTSALLKRLKVPFTALTELQAPDTPGLILGAGALKQMPPGPWRESLGAYVRGGGKVLILEQDESPDFLPVPLTLAAGRPTTLAFARAIDHPALSGLTEGDLRWWADDHYVSAGNYRKPARGNAIPIVDVGTSDGLLETPLIEEFEGQGSYLLCQLELTDKALTAPPAGRILSNLLGYLTTPGGYRSFGATALFARADSPLRRALDDSLLVYEDLTGKPAELNAAKHKVAIAEAALAVEEPLSNALHAFAAAGGRVLIHRAVPEQQAALEGLLGVKLRFLPVQSQPDDIKYRAFRRDNTGLMAGISNHELFWASNRLLVDLRHEGGWWSSAPGQHPRPRQPVPQLQRRTDAARRAGADEGGRRAGGAQPAPLRRAAPRAGGHRRAAAGAPAHQPRLHAQERRGGGPGAAAAAAAVRVLHGGSGAALQPRAEGRQAGRHRGLDQPGRERHARAAHRPAELRRGAVRHRHAAGRGGALQHPGRQQRPAQGGEGHQARAQSGRAVLPPHLRLDCPERLPLPGQLRRRQQ
ncbi:MAG: hypothetical protein HYU66_19455 [Armatimonadetes bacterium]|nr:hypothetical protein [Armatimonadota bacterium]